MSHLEHDIKEPMASPERILELVATYSSDTVHAPRNLSETLLHHLYGIANAHGGKVVLHSRLFAQWMHHAFPNECSFPHQTGSTNPQTAYEWAQANGVANEVASEEDVQKALNVPCSAEDGGDLPWNPNDEW